MQPFTVEERVQQAKIAAERLGTQIPWIVDAMDNRLKHALGDQPNSEFVLDPEGKIVRKRAWSNPQQLRQDLIELVGPVEKPTKPEDIQRKIEPPPQIAARGVLKPILRSRAWKTIRIEPQMAAKSPQPFYAKLRAEIDPGFADGKGTLYLGFYLDPIYRVHWNNLTPPMKIELAAPEGVTVSPARASSPKVEAPADIDPREFLIDVAGWSHERPIQLTVQYYACSDEPAWCLALVQRYVIRLEADPDAGWPLGGGVRTQGR